MIARQEDVLRLIISDAACMVASIPFRPVPFRPVLFWYGLFCSVLFRPVLFCSVPSRPSLVCSVLFWYVLFYEDYTVVRKR
jgi:hypothetical protein